MTIGSLDQYVAAAKQRCEFTKTATFTATQTAMWYDLWDVAGNPGAGSTNPGNAANGIVPTNPLAGAPTLNVFGGAASGYLSKVEFGCSTACRLMLFDRLFICGNYTANGTTNLASQPSFASRVPGGTDFKGIEIWC